MEAGNGNFIAQAGSDSCILLSDLKRILEAENMPGQVKRTEVLPFDFVRLGSNLSQSADGGFSPKTKGNWTTLKLFIAQGNQESEVYLNFNESLKKGQFAIKDSEYGDLLLAELAKVL